MSKITEASRRLRKSSTHAEKIFWEYVRGRKINNYKIARQHPILFYYKDKKHFFVADFFCKKRNLIIEIDGSVHDTTEQKERDTHREALCKQLGYTTIRFSNEMVLHDTEITLNILKQKLQNLST